MQAHLQAPKPSRSPADRPPKRGGPRAMSDRLTPKGASIQCTVGHHSNSWRCGSWATGRFVKLGQTMRAAHHSW
eukprot:CAMPEP_0195056654 /NCGR_PEP_ID=MMETSP0448-20130528/4949_1 /TAXON_ID=66468 /ORGANISM="Heterocapsa triquestra, Strain CCMP 448" /LENGTH=73 /DNA_ID=CAMNT_0040086493 /DNA_START=526 /DNA_END=747 /DNA_ORIENTATION=+